MDIEIKDRHWNVALMIGGSIFLVVMYAMDKGVEQAWEAVIVWVVLIGGVVLGLVGVAAIVYACAWAMALLEAKLL